MYIERTSPDIQQLNKRKRNMWTNAEDERLARLVSLHQAGNWHTIAKEMGVMENGKRRTGKQIRERYMNYIRPVLRKLPFSPEEEKIFIQKYCQYGNKWSSISKFLPGRYVNSEYLRSIINRSENYLKNFFYSKFRKFLRGLIKEINSEHNLVNSGFQYEIKQVYQLIRKEGINMLTLDKQSLKSLLCHHPEFASMNRISICPLQISNTPSSTAIYNYNSCTNDDNVKSSHLDRTLSDQEDSEMDVSRKYAVCQESNFTFNKENH